MLKTLVVAFVLALARPSFAVDLAVYMVPPSEADPAVTQFDAPNIVVFDRAFHGHNPQDTGNGRSRI